MKPHKISIFLILSITVLIFSINSLQAQGGGGPIPPAALPIGGIGALIIAGISTGFIFLKNKRRK